MRFKIAMISAFVSVISKYIPKTNHTYAVVGI